MMETLLHAHCAPTTLWQTNGYAGLNIADTCFMLAVGMDTTRSATGLTLEQPALTAGADLMLVLFGTSFHQCQRTLPLSQLISWHLQTGKWSTPLGRINAPSLKYALENACTAEPSHALAHEDMHHSLYSSVQLDGQLNFICVKHALIWDMITHAGGQKQ